MASVALALTSDITRLFTKLLHSASRAAGPRVGIPTLLHFYEMEAHERTQNRGAVSPALASPPHRTPGWGPVADRLKPTASSLLLLAVTSSLLLLAVTIGAPIQHRHPRAHILRARRIAPHVHCLGSRSRSPPPRVEILKHYFDDVTLGPGVVDSS